MDRAILMVSSPSSPSGPSEPGTQGTLAARMASLAEILSPISRITSGGGPTKMKPLRWTRSAKSAFSERKP